MAVRIPAAVGGVANSTVSSVSVAAVTVPTAPSLNVTATLATMGSNPDPWITIAGTSGRILVVAKVTTTANSSRSSKDSKGEMRFARMRLYAFCLRESRLGVSHDNSRAGLHADGFFAIELLSSNFVYKVQQRRHRRTPNTELMKSSPSEYLASSYEYASEVAKADLDA